MARADTEGSEDPWVSAALAGLPEAERSARMAELARHAPAGYREQTPPSEAALDLKTLAELAGREPSEAPRPTGRSGRPFGGRHRLSVAPGEGGAFRIRRVGDRPAELTALLRVLESFGLVVEEAVPHRFATPSEGLAGCIEDIGVHVAGAAATAFQPSADGDRLVDALEAVGRGEADVDQLNSLVVLAGLSWRQVGVLRAYRRYRSQAAAVPPGDLEAPLVAFPAVAALLVAYFEARFDPAVGTGRGGGAGAQSTGSPSGGDPGRAGGGGGAAERAACVAAIDTVPGLEEDRVLRGYLRLVDATVRTNYFLGSAAGQRPALTLKVDSASVPDLPPPRPRTEAWVHGPEVEGIHLRAGLVARGGIRFSDRPADLRTEILDLMTAQVKKNAIIVPTGAKGGFVWRGTGPASQEEVRHAYATFIRSLLDVTDNLVAGEVVHPPGVVVRDGPDPYLVVAADKGTATFSDLANEISSEYGFWLGDAFASGGSHGYDHKAMGITARGAWVAVRRHFHQLGIDVQREPVSVVGVGDMSGDVFGNAMLQSEAIRLVAAFDHRHVFLDPDPDPQQSFAERRRLFELPRSSWDDYDRSRISEGGGVWPRVAKVVPLSEQARRVLGVTAEALSPPEVISAILAAPVDLLFFGGIGTFVKAPGESDAEVGDHANDALRITTDQLRARVVAEGANLGITQLARVRYSRRGGRINTDFIDNAAGVATSDREVNLKILLALAIEEGVLPADERDAQLEAAEAEVAASVLRQVDHSVSALNRAVPESAEQLDAYEALIDSLERAGLDRGVECLPSTEELAVRREAGAGLIRPELAVLLAYAKSDLVASLEGAPLLKERVAAPAALAYFPKPVREAYSELIPRHRLYGEILATEVASEIVDELGIVWAHETAAELGRSLADVAAAYWAAREVLGAGELWEELDRSATELPAEAEARLHGAVAGALARLARSYLGRGDEVRASELVAADAPLAEVLGASPLPGEEVEALVKAGVDARVAELCLAAASKAAVGDVGPVMRGSGRGLPDALAALRLVEEAAGTSLMAEAVSGARGGGRYRAWQARALLDDLAAWQRGAAVEVLSRRGDPADPVVGWAAEHSGELLAAKALLGELSRPGSDPLTIVSLALRRLPDTGRSCA